ncbi:MAG: ATP-dependent zinc metalloprotease FtsH [Treponemataceae bacterium]|nr:ATP-dependent zinc metalloprotease FtsH [Treponemataceae bacterium]
MSEQKRDKGFVVFLGILILITVGAYMLMFLKSGPVKSISYSEFIAYVEQDQILAVSIADGNTLTGKMRAVNGKTSEVTTIIPYEDDNLLPLLKEHQVNIQGYISSPGFFAVLLNYLPTILMIFLFIMILRQNASQNSKGMQFGKSRARLFEKGGKDRVTFDDVAGQEEAKTELTEIVDFLKNPKKYQDMGARIPKGVLLVGPPGTGKTLMARAVAGEAGVNFLHISGSDFVEMFVGVGASRVRDLFEQGRRMAPAIIFIDEIDAVGRARGAGLGGGHDEREQTLNQMLVEMDGFTATDSVIVLAATNRPDVLDQALLRPGRFDRQVHVSLPDIKEREAILAVHTKKIKAGPDIDVERMARATPGMSGADLANVVNEAALFAARNNQETVSLADFENARDKILMGVDRKTMVISPKEKEMTAYHESGHTLPYYFLEHCDPLHKVTIIPRGRALGLTIGLPKEDSYSRTRSWLSDQLVIMLGGYAAEQVVYGDTTTGVSNDLQRATQLARRMVCEWGMCPEIGTVTYGEEDEPIFMGREIGRHKEFSDETAARIDREVKKLIDESLQRALSIMTGHRDMLDKLAHELVEKETLADTEIRELLGV